LLLEEKFVMIVIIFAGQLIKPFGNVLAVKNIIIMMWNFAILSLLIAFLVYQNIEKAPIPI
jgi:hypothetical protein